MPGCHAGIEYDSGNTLEQLWPVDYLWFMVIEPPTTWCEVTAANLTFQLEQSLATLAAFRHRNHFGLIFDPSHQDACTDSVKILRISVNSGSSPLVLASVSLTSKSDP